jgi:hypothetical protein
VYLARCVDRKAHAKSARQNFTSLNSLAIVGPCAGAIANPCLGRGWRHSDGHSRTFALATDFSFAGRPPCSGTDVWNGRAGKQEHAVGERSSALRRRQIICSYRSTFRSRPELLGPQGNNRSSFWCGRYPMKTCVMSGTGEAQRDPSTDAAGGAGDDGDDGDLWLGVTHVNST